MTYIFFLLRTDSVFFLHWFHNLNLKFRFSRFELKLVLLHPSKSISELSISHSLCVSLSLSFVTRQCTQSDGALVICVS